MLDTPKEISPTFSKKRLHDSKGLKQECKVKLNKFVTVHLIPSLSTYSKQEIQNSWYNQSECKSMKREMVQVLRKIIAKKLPVDGIESEARGLERQYGKRSKISSQTIRTAWMFVLDEQDRQEEMFGQVVDEEEIANISRQVSKMSRHRAICIAAKDAELVRDENRTESIDAQSVEGHQSERDSTETTTNESNESNAFFAQGEQSEPIETSVMSKIPNTIQEALLLDKEAGNTKWTDAIKKEIETLEQQIVNAKEQWLNDLRQSMTNATNDDTINNNCATHCRSSMLLAEAF